MRGLIFIAMAALLISCGERQNPMKKLRLYFDLDSLLDQQVKLLSREGYSVRKKVAMGDKEEIQIQSADSAAWNEAFIIIRDFNINKAHNAGAYSVTQKGTHVIYEPSGDAKVAVRRFELQKQGNQLIAIEGTYFEDKSIYQHLRTLRLEFNEGILTRYEVSGFQKMILNDTVRYAISGEIIPNE